MQRLLTGICLLLFIHDGLLAQELLSKDKFLEKVATHAPEIQLALQEKAMAGATIKEVRSAAMPRLNLSSGLQRNLIVPQIFLEFPDFDNAFVDPNTGEFVIENKFQGFDASLRYNIQAQVSLQQTLFNLKALYGIQAAGIYQNISEHEYRAAKTELLAEAEKLYLQTALLAEVYETYLQEEENSQRNLELAKNDHENGLISAFDLYQAELGYQESVSHRLSAYSNYQYALINLRQLAGLSLEEEIELTPDFLNDFQVMDTVAYSLGSVLAGRDDYQAALQNILLKEREIKAQRSGFVPVIEAELQYAFNAQSDQITLNENDFRALVLGVQLRWDLYTGGQRSAEVQKAKIGLEKASIQAQQQERNIASALAALQWKIQAQRQQVNAAALTQTTAAKALQLAEVNAASGLISQKALRDAQGENRKARLNYLNAIATYQQLLIDWKKTTGQYHD